MKISLRIIFIYIILLGLLSLVIWQAIFVKNSAPALSWTQVFTQILNPIWQSPISPSSIHYIPVHIENTGEKTIIPHGEIRLFDFKTRTPITHIDTKILGEKEIIQDTLRINPQNIILEPHTDRIFEVPWKGFATQKDPQSPIIFETLEQRSQKSQQFDLYFWEKLIAEQHTPSFWIQVKTSAHDMSSGVKISDFPVTEYEIHLPFFTAQKTINSGLLINIGLLFIIFLFWQESKYRKHSKNSFSSQKITQESIKSLEISAQEELEKIKMRKLSTGKIIKKIKKKS